MRERVVLLALLTILAGTAAVAIAEDEVPPPPDPAATAAKIPDRVLLDWTVDSPNGEEHLRVFSNDIVILRVEPREGTPTTETRLLSSAESQVYRGRIAELLADAAPVEESDDQLKATVRFHLDVLAADGRHRRFTWGNLSPVGLSLTSLGSLAEDLAASVRGRWKIDDGWKKKLKVGDRLIRADGVLFVVTLVDPDQDLLELKGVEQPQTMQVRWSALRDEYLPERDETGIGRPVTPPPVKP